MVTVCNAAHKFGSHVAICDLPLGHTGKHRANLPPRMEPVEWADDWHTGLADAVVNPN